MSESAVIPLNYSIKPRRRLAVTRISKLIIIGALIAACWRPTKSRWIEFKERLTARSVSFVVYRTCLQYTQPPATVAYDEAWYDLPIRVFDNLHGRTERWHSSRSDIAGSTSPLPWSGHGRRLPARSGAEKELDDLRKLYGTSHGFQQCRMGLKPLFCVDIWEGGYSSDCKWWPPLFLHGRDGGAGERLVSVHFNADTFEARDPTPISIEVWRSRVVAGPKALTCRNIALPFQCPPTDSLALNFGQPDPLDPSHFTIQFTAGARHGTIHGYLQPDDTVRFESAEN